MSVQFRQVQWIHRLRKIGLDTNINLLSQIMKEVGYFKGLVRPFKT